MTLRKSTRTRSDRGVTVVEAAFALPILLILLLAMIDLGYAEFQTSQASAAARDGARYGILNRLDNAGIETEVRDRLVGVKNATVKTPICLRGLSGTSPVVGGCASAVRGEDRIQITVEWPYTPLTLVGQAVGIGTIRGTATMVIGDKPVTVSPVQPTTTSSTTTTTVAGSTTTTTTAPTTTTTVPGACSATLLQTDRALVSKGNALVYAVKVTVTTNGETTCTGLTLRYPKQGGGQGATQSVNLVSDGKVPPTNWTATLAAGSNMPDGNDQDFDVLIGPNLIGSFVLDVAKGN